MSAQLYLSRLVDEGRTERGPRRAASRTSVPTRRERRLRRALAHLKH